MKDSLNLKNRNLDSTNVRSMLKMPYADCLGPSPAISVQFTLKMCDAAGNRKKFTENPYFGDSRSFKVIDVDTNKKLVTIACYDKQHVCAYLQPFSRYTSQ